MMRPLERLSRIGDERFRLRFFTIRIRRREGEYQERPKNTENAYGRQTQSGGLHLTRVGDPRSHRPVACRTVVATLTRRPYVPFSPPEPDLRVSDKESLERLLALSLERDSRSSLE